MPSNPKNVDLLITTNGQEYGAHFKKLADSMKGSGRISEPNKGAYAPSRADVRYALELADRAAVELELTVDNGALTRLREWVEYK